DIDPRVPFAVSALTLLATTAGLIAVERRLGDGGETAGAKAAPAGVEPRVVLFFAGSVLLALGFQVHFNLNSSGQYLRFAGPAALQVLMPVFWIGFNLLMFPGAALARRLGALPVMAGAAALGVAGMAAAGLAGNLPVLVAAQFVAGGAWGGALMAGFAGSMGFGHTGREGLMVGALSSLLAVAALLRIATAAAGAGAAADVLTWLPPGLWAIGGVAVLAAGRRAVPRVA
ncbi:MAG TPA: hypothetical protein VKS60_24160, partial [Stellaceae bacterium]|nr:hypothetical protein [Stellaceae bacterium]